MSETDEVKPTNVQLAMAALQTLTQLGLTALQVKNLLEMELRTEADVIAQLDLTEATIRRKKDED